MRFGRAPSDNPAIKPQAMRLANWPRAVAGVVSLYQQEGQHEHHAEHVGERETGLEPVERRQRHDQRGTQRHPPIVSPPIEKVEHRGDCGAGQGRDERERGRVIGDDTIDEFSRSDDDRIAGRMRLVLEDVEVVEGKGEVDRISIVEPMRTREGEQSGEAGEQQGSVQPVA